jgi:hypothetical protein
LAIASPRPLLPPVISATRPFNEVSIVFSRFAYFVEFAQVTKVMKVTTLPNTVLDKMLYVSFAFVRISWRASAQTQTAPVP